MSLDRKPLRPAVCIVLAGLHVVTAAAHAQSYGWPLRVSRIITSTFGEFREGHVHAGLDFSTGGREGLPVYAVADGYVERLRCSPFGYGKAIYVHLDDGDTAVYAHLSEFGPELHRRVETEQMRRLSYEVDLWLQPGDVEVRRGAVLGRSGSTGTGAPHLHFELRATDGCPYNPFDVFTPPADDIPPEMTAVAFIPMDNLARADGLPKPAVVPVELDEVTGKYVAARPVHLKGRIGVAVEVRDLGSQGPYRRGVHSIELDVDGTSYFAVRNDRFCYERGRQVYLSYDYSLLRRMRRRFLTIYREIGNTLSNYESFEGGDGIIDVTGSPLEVLVAARDGVGNTSEVSIDVLHGDPPEFAQQGSSIENVSTGDSTAKTDTLICQADFWPRTVIFSIRSPGPVLVAPVQVVLTAPDGTETSLATVRRSDTEYEAFTPLYPALNGTCSLYVRAKGAGDEQLSGKWSCALRVIDPAAGGRIDSQDGVTSIMFPTESVYRPLYARIEVDTRPLDPPARQIGRAYRFEPIGQLLAAKCDIRIQCPDDVPTNRIGTFRYNDRNGRWQFVARYDDTASVYELGTFALLEDDAPPAVSILTPAAGSTVSPEQLHIEIKVNDKASGLDLSSVRTQLDGQPIICEFYPPANLLRWTREVPLEPGPHTIKAVVRDNMGNETVAESEFVVQPDP